MTPPTDTIIETVDQLREAYAEPHDFVRQKCIPRLDDYCRRWIAMSPFIVLASADGAGGVDVSPRGGSPGFVRVADDSTLLLPDLPGNNRLDTLTNILASPGVGTIFFVPGFEETLRVNGTAEIVRDEDLRASFADRGKPAAAVLRITVREVYFHCSKSLKRSGIWDAATYPDRSTFPSLVEVVTDQIRANTPDEARKGDTGDGASPQ
ncbi:MSMEG_1061 family FMN-dependent PPOX-type flavoprotein [Amorphus coralli]|uniref:MSMEG_1061 family FMN-dependent PPOX-type flavoprotein n=1 Tax=Amorphus coralli TaxID=340680 RepID=UPI00036DF240|nr:MSMEG_1061 family FMN-dependent PPOX-type flavoprotein [Amorphus coralli]